VGILAQLFWRDEAKNSAILQFRVSQKNRMPTGIPILAGGVQVTVVKCRGCGVRVETLTLVWQSNTVTEIVPKGKLGFRLPLGGVSGPRVSGLT
jgi:hypothetical protein